jgi:hypothetical protein
MREQPLAGVRGGDVRLLALVVAVRPVGSPVPLWVSVVEPLTRHINGRK